MVPDIEPVIVETPLIRLSGRLATPRQDPARGLVVALPGGGYTSGYWDSPVEGQSFLALAAELGFFALALDRPGYGASRDHPPERLRVSDQVSHLYDAIETWSAGEGFEGPVFVIGHSLGGVIALMMAADPRASRLAGVDVLGVPFRYRDEGGGAAVQRFSRAEAHVPTPPEDLQRLLLFGPAGTYSAAAFAHHQTCLQPMPRAEYEDGLAAPAWWPSVLPKITVPVQVTAAEHETMQRTGWPMLTEVQALLSASPGARFDLLLGAGHDASLHHPARAYHLRAIAFFEGCLATSRA